MNRLTTEQRDTIVRDIERLVNDSATEQTRSSWGVQYMVCATHRGMPALIYAMQSSRFNGLVYVCYQGAADIFMLEAKPLGKNTQPRIMRDVHSRHVGSSIDRLITPLN